jgi:hypothetical protein
MGQLNIGLCQMSDRFELPCFHPTQLTYESLSPGNTIAIRETSEKFVYCVYSKRIETGIFVQWFFGGFFPLSSSENDLATDNE